VEGFFLLPVPEGDQHFSWRSLWTILLSCFLKILSWNKYTWCLCFLFGPKTIDPSTLLKGCAPPETLVNSGQRCARIRLAPFPVDIINENIHNLKSFMLTLRSMTTYSFRTRQKWLPVFVLSLFLLSVLAMAFHHHEDGSDHDDCPVCAAGHHYSSASVAFSSITNRQPVSSNEIPKVPFLYSSVGVALLPCRAPPA